MDGPTREPDLKAVEGALSLVRKRWKASVLLELGGGGLRFGKLHSRLPAVSHKVLTQVLRELGSDGLVARSVVPGARKHVTYTLTASGAELLPILRALGTWNGGEDS